jgi:hypothetical protein
MDEFKLSSSQALNKHFEDLCAQAKSERRGMFALESADALMLRLRKNPLGVGEPLYDLKQLHLQMRVVLQFPWSIHFSVDENRRIVYLTRIDLLS